MLPDSPVLIGQTGPLNGERFPIDGEVLIGREASCTVVVTDRQVSRFHARITVTEDGSHLEDLGSKNGTYVNGKAVKKHALVNDDTVEVGKYKIKFLDGDTLSGPASLTGAGLSVPMGMDEPVSGAAVNAPVDGPSVRVLNGAAVGRQMKLTKIVTTVGKPGVQVASITKRPGGYVLAHVEGALRPTVNGSPVTGETVQLKNGDVVELAGTQMQFVQA